MKIFKTPQGFTLIELLIVVAIIAILAAIAIPNFLQAQTRAKVARVKADFQSVATALESYEIDFNTYPYALDENNDHYFFISFTPSPGDPCPGIELTTPITYITSIPLDQFPFSIGGEYDYSYRYGYFSQNSTDNYDAVNSKYYGAWFLGSDGPDPGRTFNPSDYDIANFYDGGLEGTVPGGRICDLYDPTNGTISQGNIIRDQGGQVPNL